MERLTLRDPDGAAYIKSSVTRHEAADRLAVYEDTGLEPEEIKRIYQEWSHYLNFAGERNAIEGAIEDIYDDGNIDYNRLRELAQADREGRVEIIEPDVYECIKVVRKAQAALRREQE